MEFKVGDIVKFKSWEEMEKEYGLNLSGNIACDRVFSQRMEQDINKDTGYVIKEIYGTRVILEGASTEYIYSTDMIKHTDYKKDIVNISIANLCDDDYITSTPPDLKIFAGNIWGLLFLNKPFRVTYENYHNSAVEIVEFYSKYANGVQILYLNNDDKIKSFDDYDFTIKESGRYIFKENNALTFVCIITEGKTKEEIIDSTLKTAKMLFEAGILEIEKEFYEIVVSLDYDAITSLLDREIARLKAKQRKEKIYSQLSILKENIMARKIQSLNDSIESSKNNQSLFLERYREALAVERQLRKDLIFATSNKEANENIDNLINLIKEDHKRGEVFDFSVDNNLITVQLVLPLIYFEEEDWQVVKETYQNDYRGIKYLLDAIFNRRATVIFNNEVKVDLSENSCKGVNRRYYNRATGIPNPHIERYDCWGNNEPEILDYLFHGMYDMAYLQIKSAISGLNISDSPVMNEFCNYLSSTNIPAVVIEETGELMNSAEAEEYFEKKAEEEHYEED